MAKVNPGIFFTRVLQHVFVCTIAASFAVPAASDAEEAGSGPSSSWAGFYLGIEGGANLLTGQNYAFGGARAGYDLEFDRFIAGMEVSADYRAQRNNSLVDWTGASGTQYQTAISITSDYIGAATAHIGYEVGNRLLPYVSGGLAFSPLSMKTTLQGIAGPRAGAFGTGSLSDFRTGWIVGGGIRVALTDHWSLEPQYRYYRFPKETLVTWAYLGGVPAATYTQSDTGRGSLLGMAANYRF